jgi:DNA polymerase bacteriophage-type
MLMKMNCKLHIDIETYNGTHDLTAVGLHRYAENVEILLLAYALEGGNVEVVDLTVDPLPDMLLDMLQDGITELHAWNAAFERVCINSFFGLRVPIEKWHCTMAKSYYCGFPGSLKKAALSLKLEDQKDVAGKQLINYFCRPCKPTKANGGRKRNTALDNPEKWEAFKGYCAQDVRTEMGISKKLEGFGFTGFERALYIIDQEINDLGVLVDAEMVGKAKAVDTDYRAAIYTEALALTGLENPNGLTQLKKWMQNRGVGTESLDAEHVTQLLNTELPEAVERVLQIRQHLGKTSNAKYAKLMDYRGTDGRVRGTMQYYGAGNTGRWAGRGPQVHNLPRQYISVDQARRALMLGADISTLYSSVPSVLSQLLRTAFVAPPEEVLTVADYSAIEARVLAWLAREQWVMDVFAADGKIYEAQAASMYKVPVSEVTPDMRQRGKVAVLACGYQGGTEALISLGALRIGLTEEELPALVAKWRHSNPHITQMWGNIERAARRCVSEKVPQRVDRIRMRVSQGVLQIQLPSARSLHYARASVKDRRLSYENKGIRVDLYGGKLVENITQAVARDCLAELIMRLRHLRIVMHVHDEIVIEGNHLEEVLRCMNEPIPWAPGLLLRGTGFTTKYYRKG